MVGGGREPGPARRAKGSGAGGRKGAPPEERGPGGSRAEARGPGPGCGQGGERRPGPGPGGWRAGVCVSAPSR